MNGKPGREVALIGARLTDDAYMAWVAAETESEEALGAWLAGGSVDRDQAYFVYLAALDREEAAARNLQRLCAQAARRSAAIAGMSRAEAN
jgi:hypothetical protein